MKRWIQIQDAPAWQAILEPFLQSPEAEQLQRRLSPRLLSQTVYPAEPLRALQLCRPEQVKVLIVGQDPYHQRGQANGLAFSVEAGIKLPPSLRNILTEVVRTQGYTEVLNGDLSSWAEQGVLLLNSCLTVEDSCPAAHQAWGWEALTSAVIRFVVEKNKTGVVMLWGAHAQHLWDGLQKENQDFEVLRSNHPSPLSAKRPPQPFIGNNHFAQANAWLEAHQQAPINW